MSARLWLGFVSAFVLLSQLQVFGNPLWQSSDDEEGKVTKDGFPCYSQADCLSGECCLVYGDDSEEQGVCRKLGTTGSRCSVVSDTEQKSIKAEYCPCVKELECLASSETCRENVGMFDRFINIFSPNNDDDDNKEIVNKDNNDQQKPQEKNEEEEEEEPKEEVKEEEAQEQEEAPEQEVQEQEQEQETEVQQEEDQEADTQGEDDEDKEEAKYSFW